MPVKLDDLIGLVDNLVANKTQKHLRDIDVAVLRGAWDGYRYEEIAEQNNYTPQYLKRDVGPKLWKLLSRVLDEKVSKKNFRGALERIGRQYLEPRSGSTDEFLAGEFVSSNQTLVGENPAQPSSLSSRCDWGDATESGAFLGRSGELDTLQHWCHEDACRMVMLLGMGGIGKTSLAVQLAQSIQADYDFLIWRSLRNAPPLETLLLDLVKFFSAQTEIQLPKSSEEQIRRLMHYLRENRCLIIFDNLESLLASEITVGHYLEGFEAYRDLFQSIGEQAHRSTLILTSREKTREISLLEGIDLPVRTLALRGLDAEATQALLQSKGCRNVTPEDLHLLTEHYGGNPLALKIVAGAIQELGGGNTQELIPFLRSGVFQFDDIEDMLARQFNRLSPVERQVMYWLTINREPIAIHELSLDLVSVGMRRSVPEAVQSLTRRSLLEHHRNNISLQPVVMEYVANRLVKGMVEDILQGELGQLQTFALVKATSKDYIQQTQTRFILKAVVDNLLTVLSSNLEIETKIQQLFQQLQGAFQGQSGYAAGNLVNLMRSLQIPLANLDLSGLTVWQANFVDAELHGVNLQGADLSKSVFTSVLNATVAIAFSPDGQYLAMGNGDNKLRVRDVNSFKELHIGEGHSNWVSCLTFSPDSQTLVSGSFDQSLRFWDLETGECRQILEGHQGWIWTVAFSADGQFLASAGNDCTIRIWDVVQGQCIRSWSAGEGWIWSVAFSPDGTRLLSGGDDQSVKVWDLESEVCLYQLEGHQGRVSSVAYNDDASIIASSSFDQTIRIWNGETFTCERTLVGHTHTVLSLALSPQGEPLVASSSQDFTVRLWNYQTGACLKTLQGHPSGIWAVAFHPTDDTLASCSNDSMVKLWDVKTGQSLRTLRGYSAGIKAIAISSRMNSTHWIATGGDDEEVKLWQGETLTKRLVGHSRWVRSLSFAPDGQWLASSGNDGTVRVWDCNTGKVMKVLRGHSNMVYTVSFHPSETQLASGSDDQTVRIWDLASMSAPTILPHDSRVWSVCYSQDGRWLATGCDDNTVRIWDLATKDCVNILKGHSNLVACVVFSPDSQVLVSTSDDRTIKVWDCQSGECLRTLSGHAATVWTAAFSPDGALLASGGFDQTVRLWNWQSGELMHTMLGAGGEVWALAFGPKQPEIESWVLYSGSQDGSLTEWDFHAGKKLKRMTDQRPYESLNIYQAKGLTEAQKVSLKILGATD